MNRDDMRRLIAMMPFADSLGIELDSVERREVRGHLAWAPERCTAGGLMHGGALMTLADSLGAICAFVNLPEGAQTSTISSSANFMRGVRGGTVQAVAKLVHAGKRTIVVRTELRDDDGRDVAHVTQAQAVLMQASER